VEPPQRRSGKRFYSERDYKRLQFIQKLIQEGLTLRAMHYYLRLYPCWKTKDCPGCQYNTDQIDGTKPCWQEPNTYCQVASNQNPCVDCQPDKIQQQSGVKEKQQYNITQQRVYKESNSDHYPKKISETENDTLTFFSGHQGSKTEN